MPPARVLFRVDYRKSFDRNALRSIGWPKQATKTAARGHGTPEYRKIALTSYRNNAILLCKGLGDAHCREVPMPETAVVLYAEDDGSSPLLTWLDRQQTKVQDKCLVRTERLAELGHELRRPEADFLRDGIHELRVQHRRVNYRMLYFFHERTAVISHGLIKEETVPNKEIDLAIVRRAQFAQDPQKHTYEE